MKRALTLVVMAGACTPTAYTPPARGFALDSANLPSGGAGDVQVDVARIGAPLWGPSLVGGGARYRHPVSPTAVAEVETGFLHVTTDGPGARNRTGYTARAGVMFHPADPSELRIGATIGGGGGHSRAAGDWLSGDIGLVASGSNHWVRPVFAVEVGLNHPIHRKWFVATFENDQPVYEHLPEDIGLRFTFGLELGPEKRCAMIGGSSMRLYRTEASRADGATEDDDGFLMIGVGFRTATE